MLTIIFTASRIRYEITSGNIGGAFAVKNMTGAIYVAGALDYETRRRVSRTGKRPRFDFSFFLPNHFYSMTTDAAAAVIIVAVVVVVLCTQQDKFMR